MGIEHATIGVLVWMAFLIGPVIFYIRRARGKSDLYVRRIPGVDAIDEAAGRAAELGRPMSFTPGLTTVSPVLYACLGVLFHIARKAALYKTRLLMPQSDAQVMAVAEDVLRDAYRAEGRLASLDPKNNIYLSDEQFAYAAGYMGLMQRENVAAAFLFGAFAAESLLLAEAGQQTGAMQVAASVSPEQVSFFICTCDYTLIGEELYAASAYLTREPVQMGSLYGQDRAKLVIAAMIVVGVLIATINSIKPEWQLHNLEHYITWELW
ncbi:MAG: hypothetical protein J0M12_17315 [Deltaproteobacteria bacterium]|nr:hypothetical protein [Deltaproteobacteria bacterium]